MKDLLFYFSFCLTPVVFVIMICDCLMVHLRWWITVFAKPSVTPHTESLESIFRVLGNLFNLLLAAKLYARVLKPIWETVSNTRFPPEMSSVNSCDLN